MAIQIQGLNSTNNYIADVDPFNSMYVIDGLPAWPPSGGTSGGYYTVAGQTNVVTAASLPANTTLMAMRFSTGSSRRAYVTKMRMMISVSTVGTSALVPGTIALQRFSGGTPSAGWSRTPCRLSEISGNTSDMTSIQDSASALNTTSTSGTSIIASTLVPIFIAGGLMAYEWIVEPPQPIVLTAGDGLWLRTQVVMPATQTWVYSYTFHWKEI